MAANSSENKFSISWHDSAWIPILNAENVLDYFCQRSNTFYDKTCNNELVKMQRLDPTQIQYMAGIEYTLIHAQDPILYVIRKQNRHSPTQVTHLSLYYILAGIVYQAPDVGSMINSRLLSTIHKLQAAFDEAQSYSRYDPSKGYWWVFKDSNEEKQNKSKTKNKALEASSLFQRQRVDLLLANFAQTFPPKMIQQNLEEQSAANADKIDEESKMDTSITSNDVQKTTVKVEPPDIEMNTPNNNTDKTQSTNPPSNKRKKRE